MDEPVGVGGVDDLPAVADQVCGPTGARPDAGQSRGRGLDVGDRRRLEVGRQHEAGRPAQEVVDAPAAVRIREAQVTVAGDAGDVHCGMAADEIQVGLGNHLAYTGEGANQARAVLPLPVLADEQEPRMHPGARPDLRVVVAADADRVDLATVDAVVLDDGAGGPSGAEAASGGALVDPALMLDAPRDGRVGKLRPPRVWVLDRLGNGDVLERRDPRVPDVVARPHLDHAVEWTRVAYRAAGRQRPHDAEFVAHLRRPACAARGLAGMAEHSRAEPAKRNRRNSDRVERRARQRADRHGLRPEGLQSAGDPGRAPRPGGAVQIANAMPMRGAP